MKATKKLLLEILNSVPVEVLFKLKVQIDDEIKQIMLKHCPMEGESLERYRALDDRSLALNEILKHRNIL